MQQDWDNKALNHNLRRAPYARESKMLGILHSPIYIDPAGNKKIQQAEVYEIDFGKDRNKRIEWHMRAIGNKTPTQKNLTNMRKLKFIHKYDDI